MRARIPRWLAARRAPLLVGLLGLALAAPAIGAGFVADDHVHRVVARDDPGIDGIDSRPLDLFIFATGEPAQMRAMIDAGVMPWWSDPEAKLAFLRPLSSLSHAVDHALWPDSAAAQLAHNLVWLALALALVWAFYRRFIDVRWIAALALLLYAVDDARGPPVGWIANRNALIALALAIPVLLAHDRWRREGWNPGRWLGPAALGVALLAGEAALAITAYLGAYALHLDRASWRDRLVSLVPYLLVVAAWRLAYQALGYGVHGSGVYLDPGAQPLTFLVAALERLPLLLLGQLGLPWSDLGSLYPLLGAGVVIAMVALAVGFLALLAFVAAPLLRADPVSRFFATGMILAAVPVCSTFPADRLLGFVALGAMGLVARLLAAAFTERRSLGASRPRRALAVATAALLVFVHLVLAPPLLVVRARAMITIGDTLDRVDATLPAPAELTGRTLVLATTAADPFAGYLPLMRASRGEPRPAHMYWLANATSAIRFERVDARTLRVSPTGGFLRYSIDHMLRSPARPFVRGQRIELAQLVIEVEEITADGRPLRVLARFAAPLEDPGYLWMRWDELGYVPWSPPAPGQAVELPAIDFLRLILDPPDPR